MHKRRRGHDACIEDKPADAELPRHRPHTPRLLVITGRKRRRHKTPSQISRARFSSPFKPLNRSWQPAAADLAETTRRHIWKQDWITKELERSCPLKALKRKTALRGVGGWWGGRTVNKLDHLILPFRECPCRSGSLLLKVSPSKMFLFFSFFLFFLSFPFPLDTYRENEDFDRESSHCLPLDFRLLAVDGSGCFCEAGVAEW